MKIICSAAQVFSCEPAPIFELMLDTQHFPSCFSGYGLIPAIRSIRLNGVLAVGSTRQIHNADNSVLTEHITVLDKPQRHCYSLSGFQAPFSWLVKHGESDWQLNEIANATKVNWRYEFALSNAFLYPISFILLKFFMQRAMQRCLQNMNAFCNASQKTD